MVGPRKNGRIDVDLCIKIDYKVPKFGLGSDTEAHLCGNYYRSIATTHVDTSGELVINVSMSTRWLV